jgi:hypothetical protein
MNRTTVETLRILVDQLNDMAGMPRDAWVRDEHGINLSVEGVYVLDSAYGGYRLSQIVGRSGGERDITGRYGAAITAGLIRAYMAGIEAGQRQQPIARAAAGTMRPPPVRIVRTVDGVGWLE